MSHQMWLKIGIVSPICQTILQMLILHGMNYKQIRVTLVDGSPFTYTPKCRFLKSSQSSEIEIYNWSNTWVANATYILNNNFETDFDEIYKFHAQDSLMNSNENSYGLCFEFLRLFNVFKSSVFIKPTKNYIFQVYEL